jgi:hypothetical protein
MKMKPQQVPHKNKEGFFQSSVDHLLDLGLKFNPTNQLRKADMKPFPDSA